MLCEQFFQQYAFHLPFEILIEAMIEGFNQAIEDADHVNENEMKSTAFNILPGMGK